VKTIDKQQVIVADDHIMIRDALASIVNTFPNFIVSGLASNGRQVQELLKVGTPANIILLDINMPEMDGYETSAWLALHHPEIKILVLSMYENNITFLRMLQEGARGFLTKDSTPKELHNALEAVAEHGCYYPIGASSKMAAFLKRSRGIQSVLEKSILTQQEIDFLKLACTDMAYKEIAAQMNLSASAIENLRQSLFEKINVSSRVGLAVYAIKNGIVIF